MDPSPDDRLPTHEALVPRAAAPGRALSLVDRRDGQRHLVDVRPRRRFSAFALLGPLGIIGALALLVAQPLLAPQAIQVGAAAVALTLLGLQRLSRLSIRFDPERVVIAHRPLPTRRALVERTHNVEGFYVGERYAGSAGGSDGRCWVIELRTHDGRVLELPLRLPAPDGAAETAAHLNRTLREVQTPMTYRG